MQISVTDLRTNQVYVTYYNQWARLFVMGFIPAVMLIYFNYKVRVRLYMYRDGLKKWSLGCVNFLPSSAWLLLSKTGPLFSPSLYNKSN